MAVIEVLEVKVKLVIVEVGSAFRKSLRFNEVSFGAKSGAVVLLLFSSSIALNFFPSVFSVSSIN